MIGRRHWQEVDRILERVLGLPADDRAAAVDEECADDAEIRQQVLSLLAAEDETDPLAPGAAVPGAFAPSAFAPSAVLSSRSQRQLLDRLDATADTEPRSLEGENLGPYTLGRELGRGGMAIVYAGERTDNEFDQQVAIKLLFSGGRSSEIHERFRSERRILASLDHPNITRLLDGGASPDGRPYFVMERVDGESIDRYCDRHRIALRPRLRLWLAVADAVAHAHRRLLVHRDLKPSNVLVTAEGQVKLLDFGIAKVLTDRDPRSVDLTRTGSRPMTPRYASPEQIAEFEITTATDVYQLGVLLYELLTGTSPYRVEGDSTVEWEDAIRHQEPAKPSLASRRRANRTRSLDGAERGSVVNPHGLTGDLDAIILKALAKEPDDRYGSAEAMAADVERFLSGRPVLARPATLWYRARRFLRRHRGAATVVLAAIVFLSALVAFHTYRLSEERDRARQEADKAEQVTEFLTDIFRGGNPEVTGRDDLLARELLDQGARRIDEQLAGQPAVRSQVQSVIGVSYLALGRYKEAEALQEAALDTLRELSGDHAHEVSRILLRLGTLHMELGNFERADEILREALVFSQEAPETDELEIAKILNNHGLVSRQLSRLDQARMSFEEAIAIKERILAPDHPSLAHSVVNLAVVLSRMKQYDRSVELSRRAIAIYDSGDEPEYRVIARNLALAQALTNLSSTLRKMGDLEEAQRHAERALKIKERAYGMEHPRVASTINILANVKYRLGDLKGARLLYGRALDIYRQGFGPNHPYVATPLNNLGELSLQEGDLAAARRFLGEALQIKIENLGPNHPSVLTTRVSLANVALQEGNHAAAEAQLHPALEGLRRRVEGGETLSEALLLLGGVFIDTGRVEEAEPMLRESFALRTKSFGRDHRETALVLVALGRCLHRSGRETEAIELWQEVSERFQESDPDIAASARSALRTSS